MAALIIPGSSGRSRIYFPCVNMQQRGVAEVRIQSLSGLHLPDVGDIVKKVKFVVGIEDRVYMRWQLAILLESLLGKLPDGWEPWVVVCNDHRSLSTDLQRLLDAYGTRHFTGADRPHRENMDFAAGEDVYVPINRIEALNVVGDHVVDDDLVFLTETDIFLYEDLNPRVFPQGNALFDNWLVRQDVFFTHGGAHEKAGMRLATLLEAMGCTTPFKPGGVTNLSRGRDGTPQEDHPRRVPVHPVVVPPGQDRRGAEDLDRRNARRCPCTNGERRRLPVADGTGVHDPESRSQDDSARDLLPLLPRPAGRRRRRLPWLPVV